MLREVVVGAIRDAFEFLASKRKTVFDIVSAFRIEGALIIRHCHDVQLVARDTNVLIKLQAFFLPIFEQFHSLLCAAKIFELHLFEFSRAEGEIARINFVAKRFADLRDPERQFLARHFQNVFELNKDRLRGLGP